MAFSLARPSIVGMDIRQQFGRALRKFRTEMGLTQEELAFRAKLNTSYISDLERGLYNPTLQIMVDLGKALGVHPSHLIRDLNTERGRTSSVRQARRPSKPS